METNDEVKLTIIRRCLKVDGGYKFSDFYSERKWGSSHDVGTQTFEWDWDLLKDKVQPLDDQYPIKIDHVVIKRDKPQRMEFHQRIPSRLCKASQTGEDASTVHKDERHLIPPPPSQVQQSSKSKKVNKYKRGFKRGETLTLQEYRARLGLPVKEDEDIVEVDAKEDCNVPMPEVEPPIPNDDGEIPQVTISGSVVLYKLCRRD